MLPSLLSPGAARSHLATFISVAALSMAVAKGPATEPAAAAPSSGGSRAARAYAFLDHMMDLYATGSTLRLVQSFEGGALERQHFTDSETYETPSTPLRSAGTSRISP